MQTYAKERENSTQQYLIFIAGALCLLFAVVVGNFNTLRAAESVFNIKR